MTVIASHNDTKAFSVEQFKVGEAVPTCVTMQQSMVYILPSALISS